MNIANERFAILNDELGEAVPLVGVAVEARLLDLLAVVEVTQTFRNVRKTAIEAVYTFPLPDEAVLLDLELELGERRLSGVVTPRAEAEARYEEALDQGHSALLLQRVDDGLYTLGLGNLMPGEEAVIRFRYGLFQRWNGSVLRFALPTAMAPRYGDPARAGLMPHQVPGTSLDVHYPFSLKVTALGQLARARVSSPTHAIAMALEDDGLAVTLARPAALDRDFVLAFDLAGQPGATAWHARDGEGWALWASVCPDLPEDDAALPRSLRLLVDCSGSMGGDSIAQARRALLDILDRLRETDQFNLVAFGSTHTSLFHFDVPADSVNLALARAWVKRLDADMGGTELCEALEAVLAPESACALRDLLLITDGEVYEDKTLHALARRHHTRVFPVGVGSAPAQEVLRRLARASGGAAEFVTPGEDMAARIVRHFERIRQASTAQVQARWPVEPAWRLEGETGLLFSGDTLHVFAGTGSAPTGEFAVECALAEGGALRFAAPWQPAPDALAADLPRLVAARRMQAATDPEVAQSLALRYRLVSEHTHYLVVAERAEGQRAEGLPALAAVPQMLAAGWGGTGSVVRSPDVDVYSPPRLSAGRAHYPASPGPIMYSISLGCLDFSDDMSEPTDAHAGAGLDAFIRALDQALSARQPRVGGADWLQGLGAPKAWIELVRRLAASPSEQAELVMALLVLLLPHLEREALGAQARSFLLHLQPTETAIGRVNAHMAEVESCWQRLSPG